MKTVNIYKTKKVFFATENQKDFFIKTAKEKAFRPMTNEELTTKTAYKNSIGWEPYQADSFEQALEIRFNEIENRRKLDLQKAILKDQQTKLKIDELLSLPEIPLTVENLNLLMIHLNSQNWGGWDLPKMSVSYTANQYDCDGTIATTVELDQPLNGKTKFSINAPFNYLNKYTNIQRF